MKENKIIVKGVTGKENLEYETRLVRGSINVLVGVSDDKYLQRALARDLFRFLRAITPDVVLADFTDYTETVPTSDTTKLISEVVSATIANELNTTEA